MSRFASFSRAMPQRRRPHHRAPVARPASRAPALQAKLAIGPVDDPLEREADRVAEAVVGGGHVPPVPPAPPAIQRKCSACEEDEGTLHRKGDGGAADVGAVAPSGVRTVLSAPGRPLDAEARAYFEPRFGRDFGDVRIHTGGDAERSAHAIGARAYTSGSDIVFAEYAPQTDGGRALIAHELTHVLQQRGGEARISRAPIQVGSVKANTNYKDVEKVPAKGRIAAIKKKHQAYVKAPLDPAAETQITGFSEPQQKWLLFGIDLLIDNDKLAPGLDHAKAEQALIDRAASATTQPAAPPADAFEQEVFTVSGWSEEAISGGYALPTYPDLAVIDPLYNPPPSKNAPASGKFAAAKFFKDLDFETRYSLLASKSDPSNWPAGKRAQPLSDVKSVADVVQEQARLFFSPYVETAKGNRYAAGFKYSSIIESVTTDASGNPRTVPADERKDLLVNRAERTGRDDSKGPSIFARTNFDPVRDAATFDAVITGILKDSTFVSLLDDLARHTGHHSRATKAIGISTEVDAGISECDTRWTTIRTLCHELVHALAHPDFIAAQTTSPRIGKAITFDQVVVEGFTEVLGVQLYAYLMQIATPGTTLNGNLTNGVKGTCAPPTATPKPGYKAAGPAADTIRQQVGDDRFRAAYFHGRVALVGL
jgi:Domain of unknown function (DUF4157)